MTQPTKQQVIVPLVLLISLAVASCVIGCETSEHAGSFFERIAAGLR